MSGSYQSAMATLRTYLKTSWAAVRSTVPVEMPNSTTGLNGSAFVKPAAAPWGRFSILTDLAPITLAVGATPERAFGTALMEIFTPLQGGEALGLAIADDYAAFWRNYPLADFLFQPTRVVSIGRPDDDPAWWKTDALTQFEREYVP